MFHIAVLINTAGVIAGSLLGMLGGKGLSERFRRVLFQAIGLLTIGLGVKMFLDVQEPLIVLGSMAAGGLIGEALRIEEAMGRLAEQVGRGEGAHFARGFVLAFMLFVPGPMTIIGSLQAGIQGDGQLILIKSLMDFISSIMLATVYGAGVLLSAIGVFVVQGLLVQFASSLSFLQEPRYLADLTAVGGLMLLAIGVRMLELREIKVGNYLPALVIAPALSHFFG